MSTGSDKPTFSTPPARPVVRKRKLRRWVKVLLWFVALTPVWLVVLTQGPIATWMVGRAVRSSIGGSFGAGWTSVRPDGRVVIDELKLTAPGLSGPSSEVLTAKRVELEVDWSLWSLSATPTSVRIEGAALRLSQSTRDGSINVASFKLPEASTAARSTLPRIELVGAKVELGEHDRDLYKPLYEQSLRGSLAPSDAAGQKYTLELRQETPGVAPSDKDVLLSGQSDLAKGEGRITLSSLELNKWSPDKVPSFYRELWRSLRMRGQVAGAEFRYDKAHGIEAELRLKDVALNVPVASGRVETTGGRMPRMEEVTGTLRFSSQGFEAALDGLFEDLPCKVTVRTEGIGLEVPYSAVIQSSAFRLEKDPRILWFAPEIVQKNFERFGGPTALVDARIDIKRSAPQRDGTAPTAIAGTMRFKEGQAALESFPYPIGDLAGTFTFNDDEMRIIEMVGRGNAGARLYAEGRWGMHDLDSSCDLNVTFTDAPIDATLEQAIEQSGASPLVRAILSRAKYQELIDRGLIITPERQKDLQTRLKALADAGRGESDDARAIERELTRPAFAFAGTIDKVVVSVKHPKQKNAGFTTNIDVSFRPVGLVADSFPYPLIADDLTLKIDDHQAVMEGKSFRGLRGGISKVFATIELPTPEQRASGAIATPRVVVDAQRVPLDDLLIHAMPESALGPGGASVKRALSSLNIDGTVDCKAEITQAENAKPGELAYTVAVGLNSVNAKPAHRGEGTPALISALMGNISFSRTGVKLGNITGDVSAQADPAGGPALGRFAATGTISADNQLELSLKLTQLPLEIALEDLISAVDPRGSEIIAKLRSERHPSGHIDADLQARTLAPLADGSRPMELNATVRGARNLEFDALDGRPGLTLRQGTAALKLQTGEAAPPAQVTLDRFVADASFDQLSSGTLELTGQIELPSGARPLGITRELRAQTQGARFETPLVRKLLSGALSSKLASTIFELNPRGSFDATVRLTPDADKGDPTAWSLTGTLNPKSLEITREKTTLSFDRVDGAITIEPGAGRIASLVASGDGIKLAVDGSWKSGSTWSADLAGAIQSTTYSPQLAAILPPAVNDAARELSISIDRGLWMDDAKLTLAGSDAGTEQLTFAGTLNFADLAGELGVAVSGADGTLGVNINRTGIDAAPDVKLHLKADRARIAGLETENLRARMNSGPRAGEWLIPGASADAYGGRITGAGTIAPVEGTSQYQLKVELAGVRLADLLNEREAAGAGRMGPPTPEQVAAAQLASEQRKNKEPAITIKSDGDLSRGRLDAEIAITGQAGKPGDRRGRGSARIAGGDIVRIPTVLPIIEVSNLSFPTGSKLDYAQADFFLEGDRITFDALGAQSSSISILGNGTILLPDYRLDLRFTSQGRARVPLISDLIEAVRNEIATVRVTGTAENPKISTEAFSGTRDALGTIFGTGPSRPKPNADAEKRSEQDRNRTGPIGGVPSER